MIKYKPDLVILNLNSTDIGDIISRGGGERNHIVNGNLDGPGPWWEFLFGSSYLVRLIAGNGFHLNWLLMSHKKEAEETVNALRAISEQIKAYQQLAQQNHFAFLLIIQPLQQDLENNILTRLTVDSAIKKIDLTPCFNQKIIGNHEPINKYYWPIDGHFTTTGYGLEANIIYTDYFAHEK